MAEVPFLSRVVRSTTPTSTGTADYTSSGLGTPVGIIVQVVPTTTDDTSTAGMTYSWGVSDGAEDRCCAGFSEDGVGTSNCGNAGSVDHCVYLLSDDGATVLVEASFSAWITDGVRLNYTVVDSTAYTIVVTMFGGDQCKAAVDHAQVTSGSSSGVTTDSPNTDASFDPEIVFTADMGSDDESLNLDFHCFFGIAADSTTVKNASAGAISADNIGTTASKRRYLNSRLAERYTWSGSAPTLSENVWISAFVTGGFTLNRTGTTNPSPRIAFLALRLSDNGDVLFELETDNNTQTSTGTQAKTWPGHETGFLYSVNAASTNLGLQNGAAVGCGVTDITTEFSFVVRDERNVGTSDTACYSTAAVFNMYNHTGATEIYDAVIDSQDATGYTIDWIAASSNARKHGQISIMRTDGLMRASTFGVASPTASISATVPIDGSASGAATGSATATGTGELEATASGAATLSATVGGNGGLAGLSSGVAALSGTAVATAALAGTSSGVSTLAGTMGATVEIVGTSDGISSLSGTISALANIEGTTSGAAALSATASTLAGLIGAISGAGTTDATLGAMGELTGALSASATVTGTMQTIGSVQSIIGNIFGAAIVLGTAADGSGAGVYEATSNVVRARFSAQLPSLTAIYDNDPQATPEDSTWVRVSVKFRKGDQLDQTPAHRVRGDMVCEVHVPVYSGASPALTVADQIAPEFRNVLTNSVYFGAPYITRAGLKGEEWVLLVTVPFYIDRAAIKLAKSGAEQVDFETMNNTIRSRFKTQIGDTHPAVEIQYDNAPDPRALNFDGLFVRFTILPGMTEQVATASVSRFRTPGVAVAQITQPVSQGNQAVLALADDIADAFRAVTDNGVVFRTPYPEQVGRVGANWQLNLNIPFFADDLA